MVGEVFVVAVEDVDGSDLDIREADAAGAFLLHGDGLFFGLRIARFFRGHFLFQTSAVPERGVLLS